MDYPYIVLILLLLILAYSEWRQPSKSDKYFKISCTIVFVFIAFRAPVVGADTWDYYRWATRIRNFYNYDHRDPEILYQLYNEFFRRFCPNGLVFMVCNTLLVFSPIYYLLRHYVKYKTFGVLSFFLFFNYVTFFVALRQILSLAIILWGAIYVSENKRNKWLVFVILGIIAWFMHTTAAIVVPLFLIAYIIPLKKRIIPIAAIIITATFGIILQSFSVLDAFNFFLSLNYGAADRISGYLEHDDFITDTFLTVALRSSVMGIIAFTFIDEEKLNHWFSKIYLLGILIYNLFISVPIMQRMVTANMLFIIIVTPWIFESKKYVKEIKTRKIINIVFVIVILYYVRSFVIVNTTYDLDDSGRMHPYYFFFQDYNNHPSIRNYR